MRRGFSRRLLDGVLRSQLAPAEVGEHLLSGGERIEFRGSDLGGGGVCVCSAGSVDSQACEDTPSADKLCLLVVQPKN